MAHQVMSIAEHARRSERKANEVLAPAEEGARGASRVPHVRAVQPSVGAIVDAAKLFGCDAIIMGSHGRSGISRLMHGSQAIDVMTHTLPTLVVR